MIRPITPNDTAALLALADAVGLFGPDELEEVEAMLNAHFTGSNGTSEFWLTSTQEDRPIGVAYCAPERMTEGAWNLLLIVVHPEWQGKGYGAALIRHVEQRLAAAGERLLLVETSAGLEQARAFYRKCGYDEEARIRDYYQAGDDKIIYRKLLTVRS